MQKSDWIQKSRMLQSQHRKETCVLNRYLVERWLLFFVVNDVIARLLSSFLSDAKVANRVVPIHVM